MKNIRKILAVILCFATLMTLCIPFASADEATTEITQETPETEIPEEDEIIDEETVPEEESTYFERLKHCFNGGLQNLMNAGVFFAGTATSPIIFFVFPPIAVALGLAGLPAGAASFIVGIGEIITSPILAFFYDTDDYMSLF